MAQHATGSHFESVPTKSDAGGLLLLAKCVVGRQDRQGRGEVKGADSGQENAGKSQEWISVASP